MARDERRARPDTAQRAGPMEIPGVGTYEWSPRNDRVAWSPELLALFGIERAPHDEAGFSALVHPDDRTRVEAETAAYLAQGDSYVHEFRIVRPDGTIRIVCDRGAIERADDGSALRLRGVNVDVTPLRNAQIEAEARLRESKMRLQLAHEVANIGAWDLDLVSHASVWSPKLYELLGCRPALGASERLFFECVHPDDRAWVRERFESAISERSTFDEIFRIVRGDGEVRFFAGKGQVVEEAGNRPRRMIGVNYDVTDRIRTEERSRHAAREAHHRLKNLLTVIMAIARQTIHGSSSDFLDPFLDRLHALAAAQDLLFYTSQGGADLDRLIRSQIAHVGDFMDSRIRISGPSAVLDANAAQAIGMAFHELATNAVKYGALSNSEGWVDVRWTLDLASPGERRLTVTWTEHRGPTVVPPSRRGFGTTVIKDLVENAVNGAVEINYRPRGFSWTLTCADNCLAIPPR